jgi:hypothetical protein
MTSTSSGARSRLHAQALDVRDVVLEHGESGGDVGGVQGPIHRALAS